MKKILALIVWLFAFTSITSAAATWDCSFTLPETLLVWRDENNTGNAILANLAKAMPKEAIEKAYQHLKSYCCDVNISTDCTQNNNNEIYPQSIYLFDHILDVYLRRLDAKQKDDNWEDLLYWLEPDEMWKEWREFIIARGNDVKWTVPLEIKDKFSSMRKHSTNVTNFMGNYDNWIKLWKGGFEENLRNYSYRTLWDKYNLACDVSKYISEYKLLFPNSDSEQKSGSILKATEYNACKKLTKARINNETVYTQVLLMQKANVLLWSSVKSYLGTYFISNKLTALQEKVSNMASSFAEVNNAVWQLIPECNS